MTVRNIDTLCSADRTRALWVATPEEINEILSGWISTNLSDYIRCRELVTHTEVIEFIRHISPFSLGSYAVALEFASHGGIMRALNYGIIDTDAIARLLSGDYPYTIGMIIEALKAGRLDSVYFAEVDFEKDYLYEWVSAHYPKNANK